MDATGLSGTELATIVFVAVTAVTAIVVVIGLLIDRSAAKHERQGDR